MRTAKRHFDPNDRYKSVLNAADVSDVVIRRLIQKADEENISMRGRTLHLPAHLGDLYGCDIVFDDATEIPYISGNKCVNIHL